MTDYRTDDNRFELTCPDDLEHAAIINAMVVPLRCESKRECGRSPLRSCTGAVSSSTGRWLGGRA